MYRSSFFWLHKRNQSRRLRNRKIKNNKRHSNSSMDSNFEPNTLRGRDSDGLPPKIRGKQTSMFDFINLLSVASTREPARTTLSEIEVILIESDDESEPLQAIPPLQAIMTPQSSPPILNSSQPSTSGYKRVPCKFPGCSRSFTAESSRVKHYNTIHLAAIWSSTYKLAARIIWRSRKMKFTRRSRLQRWDKKLNRSFISRQLSGQTNRATSNFRISTNSRNGIHCQFSSDMLVMLKKLHQVTCCT